MKNDIQLQLIARHLVAHDVQLRKRPLVLILKLNTDTKCTVARLNLVYCLLR